MCVSDITTIQLYLGQEIGRGKRKKEGREKGWKGKEKRQVRSGERTGVWRGWR